MVQKSWMPLWLAILCAGVALAVVLINHVLLIWTLVDYEIEYSVALSNGMSVILVTPPFWLLSYIRYNQFANIKWLPPIGYLIWSSPALLVANWFFEYNEPYHAYHSIFIGLVTVLFGVSVVYEVLHRYCGFNIKGGI